MCLIRIYRKKMQNFILQLAHKERNKDKIIIFDLLVFV